MSIILRAFALALQLPARFSLRCGERFCGATRHQVAACWWIAGVAAAAYLILFHDKGPSVGDWGWILVCCIWTFSMWGRGRLPESALVTGDRSRFTPLAAIDAFMGLVYLLVAIPTLVGLVAHGTPPGPTLFFMPGAAVLDIPSGGGGHPLVQRTWAKLRDALARPATVSA